MLILGCGIPCLREQLHTLSRVKSKYVLLRGKPCRRFWNRNFAEAKLLLNVSRLFSSFAAITEVS
jgi:hypothetical protein